MIQKSGGIRQKNTRTRHSVNIWAYPGSYSTCSYMNCCKCTTSNIEFNTHLCFIGLQIDKAIYVDVAPWNRMIASFEDIPCGHSSIYVTSAHNNMSYSQTSLLVSISLSCVECANIPSAVAILNIVGSKTVMSWVRTVELAALYINIHQE